MDRRPMRLLRPLPVVALVLSCGALLAACGGSSAPPTTTRSRTKTSHPSTTAPPTSTTSGAATSSSAPSTTAVAAAPTCSTGVLQVAPNGVQTSAGTTRLHFAFTNGGPQACSLEGYPTVDLFGPSGAGGAGAGANLGFADVHLGGPAKPVTLASGGRAQFVLSVAEVPVNGAACVTVASLQISPPGSSESLSLPDSFEACGTDVGVYPVTVLGS